MKFTSYLGGALERDPLPPLGLGEHSMQLAVPVVVMTLGDHKAESIGLIRTLLQDRLEEPDAVCFEDLREVVEDLVTDDTDTGSRDSFSRREAFGKIDPARLKERLSAMADRLHNEIGEYSFQGKGTIRISLLVRADDAMAGSLPVLTKAIRECYTAYFMSQCIVEAFVFLDQRAFFDERADERYAGLYQALRDTEDLRRGHVLDSVFVLSNMNSLEVMDEENEREGYLCVGYEILATTEIRAWRNRSKGLNLSIFQQKIDNANLGNDIEGGLLYSLGYRHLEQDHNLVFKSMCCGVLRELGQSGESSALNPSWLENEFKRCMPGTLNPARDLKKLFRDLKTEESQLHSAAVGRAMRHMFGRNMDLYFQLNLPSGDALRQKVLECCRSIGGKVRSAILNGNVTLFETEQYYLTLVDICRQNAKTAREQQGQFEADLKAINNLNYSNFVTGLKKKRTGDTLELVVSEYMERLRKIYMASYLARMADMFASQLSLLLQKYQQYTQCIQEAGQRLEKEISFADEGSRMDPERRPGTRYVLPYYSEEAAKACRGSRAFADLLQAISLSSEEDSVFSEEKLYELIYTYVRENLYSDRHFRQEFLEEICSRMIDQGEEAALKLTTASDVYDQTLGDIDQCRHILCKASYGSAQEMDMMCFFQNQENAFARSENISSHAINEIRAKKLRISPDPANRALDVLYVGGNIAAEGIYLYQRYQNAYEKLTKGRNLFAAAEEET